MKFPTLYKTVKSGKVQQWKIWTEENIIFNTFGFEDGKMRDPTQRECQGKNIGRANETTPSVQAEQEALTKWKKQVEKGYEPKSEKGIEMAKQALTTRQEKGTNRENAKDLDRDKQLIVAKVEHPLKIMKGKKYNEITRDIVPGFVQPKFDGIRCLSSLSEDGVAMTSSSGKQFVYLGHIKKALAKAFKKWGKKIVLDGECYNHDLEFRDITAACRTNRSEPHEKEEQLEYHIFDIAHTDLKQEQRLELLSEFFDKCVKEDGPLKLCPTYECDGSPEHLDKLKAKMEKRGYEGIIFRFKDGVYNTKSIHVDDVFKYKSFIDAEYEIVGWKAGKGVDKFRPVWKCKVSKDKFVDARMMGKTEDCKKMLEQADSFIGKMLTVKYQEMSPDGIPRFPCGIAIRDYE
jgi:DNA ligase-1